MSVTVLQENLFRQHKIAISRNNNCREEKRACKLHSKVQDVNAVVVLIKIHYKLVNHFIVNISNHWSLKQFLQCLISEILLGL